MPTERSLKKSLDTTFVNSKKFIYTNGTDRVDLCCRSLHKCDAHKRSVLNYTNESYIRHCECVHSFENCLKNLNSSLSNKFAFLYAVNTSKCYAIDHPIIKCKKFDAQLNELKAAPLFKVMNSAFIRCIEYVIDQSQPKELQIFDVPFNSHAISAFKCK